MLHCLIDPAALQTRVKELTDDDLKQLPLKVDMARNATFDLTRILARVSPRERRAIEYVLFEQLFVLCASLDFGAGLRQKIEARRRNRL